MLGRLHSRLLLLLLVVVVVLLLLLSLLLLMQQLGRLHSRLVMLLLCRQERISKRRLLYRRSPCKPNRDNHKTTNHTKASTPTTTGL